MSTSYDRSATFAPAPVRPAQNDDHSPSGAEVRSIVDRHSSFNGVFRSARDVRVEGVLEGEITCEGLVLIAQGARVKATVTAREVEVAGDLDGEVSCSGRFSLAPTGNARGKVTAASLSIEEGAKFDGDFNMMTEAIAAKSSDSRASTSSRRNSETPSPVAAVEAGGLDTVQPDRGDKKAG